MNTQLRITELQKTIAQQEEIISLQRKLIAKYEGAAIPKKKYTYSYPGYPELLKSVSRADIALVAATHSMAQSTLYSILNGTRGDKTQKAITAITALKLCAAENAKNLANKQNQLKVA